MDKKFLEDLGLTEEQINSVLTQNTAELEAVNKDVAKYGAFAGTKDSNGVAYQPKGISGYGTVSKTSQKVFVDTKTKSGTKKTVIQNVWKTKDGTKWYWEGRENKYKKL